MLAANYHKAESNPFLLPFRIGFLALLVTAGTALCFVVPPTIVLVPVLAVVFLSLVWQHPTTAMGILFAWLPFEYLVIFIGRFLHVPLVEAVSNSKEPLLLLLILILWRRNGIHFTTPDWFLLSLFAMAGVHLLFGGSPKGFQDDFAFVLPYFAGRVAVLTAQQESLWAKWAVWIAAFVSALGMIEVFYLGFEPRTLLYYSVAPDVIENGGLNAAWRAAGFSGIRESSTMVGPLFFAAFCMVALIIWWVYFRNPLPAMMVAAGLICSVSRSGWIGTALAIPLVAVRLGQQRRLLIYAGLAMTLFLAAIPVLGLSDYLSINKTGQEVSVEGHAESVSGGLSYSFEHPLGTGPGSVGPRAWENSTNAIIVETTYFAMSAQYGIAAGLCFIGFLISALRSAWLNSTRIGHTAFGILFGVIPIMTVILLHTDFRLACWLWFPVGLAVAASSRRDSQLPEEMATV